MKERLKVAIEKYFRPEFLNRLDDVIVFHALNKDDLKRIVDIELGKIRGRMSDRGLELVLDDEVEGLLDPEGLQPGLRGSPAPPGHREPDREPVERRDPAKLVQRQRRRQSRRLAAKPRKGSSLSSQRARKSGKKPPALVAVGDRRAMPEVPAREPLNRAPAGDRN